MNNTKARLAILLACGLVLLVVGTHTVLGALSKGPSAAFRPADPAATTCQKAGGRNCNPDPSAYPTFVAEHPLTKEPVSGASLVPEAQVISEARQFAATTGTSAAPVTAAVHARLMRRGEMEREYHQLGANGVANVDGPVWVVTVHAPVNVYRGLAYPAQAANVYTVVFDAETGQLTDTCVGEPCNVLG